MANNDFTTSLHWWQHSKILESPNKHNVMTSFGIRLIIIERSVNASWPGYGHNLQIQFRAKLGMHAKCKHSIRGNLSKKYTVIYDPFVSFKLTNSFIVTLTIINCGFEFQQYISTCTHLATLQQGQ